MQHCKIRHAGNRIAVIRHPNRNYCFMWIPDNHYVISGMTKRIIQL